MRHYGSIRQPLLWLSFISCIAAFAAAQDGDFIPDDSALRTEIEILVDVSGTMHPETTNGAVQVVADLILGHFRRPESGRQDAHAFWQPYEGEDREMLDYLRPKANDGELKYYFTEVDYFRRLFTGEGKVEPLAGDSDLINITFFGDRERTLDPEARSPFRLGELHHLVKRAREEKFRDEHTNLKLALAQIRKRKGREDRYYLFVISDCQEDSEQNKDDEKTLTNWGPENSDDKAHVVALLAHQPPGKAANGRNKPYICMMAVGFDPLVPLKEDASEKDVEVKKVPKIGGAIRLLGGLASETPKVFRNQVPFLAWQIECGPEDEGTPENYKFRVIIEDPLTKSFGCFAMNGPGSDFKTRISLDQEHLFYDKIGTPWGRGLPPGNWKVTVEEQNGLLKPMNGNIIVLRERIAAMPVAILAGLTSLLLFVYSWWAVRQRRSVGAR